jgi:hypothetical protein
MRKARAAYGPALCRRAMAFPAAISREQLLSGFGIALRRCLLAAGSLRARILRQGRSSKHDNHRCRGNNTTPHIDPLNVLVKPRRPAPARRV